MAYGRKDGKLYVSYKGNEYVVTDNISEDSAHYLITGNAVSMRSHISNDIYIRTLDINELVYQGNGWSHNGANGLLHIKD